MSRTLLRMLPTFAKTMVRPSLRPFPQGEAGPISRMPGPPDCQRNVTSSSFPALSKARARKRMLSPTPTCGRAAVIVTRLTVVPGPVLLGGSGGVSEVQPSTAKAATTPTTPPTLAAPRRPVFLTATMSASITVPSAAVPDSPKGLDALAARLDPTRLRRDEPLAPYTTFRIGGPADLLYDATSADDLANAILAARELGVPHFVLGLGANILVG